MATKNPTRIFWDTVVIIDSLEQEQDRYEWIKPLLQRAEAGEIEVVVSTIAMVEFYHINGVAPQDEVAIIQGFFDRTYVRLEALFAHICEISRDLRREFDLDRFDSVHIATAKATGCPILLTNDGENLKKKKPMLPLDKRISIDGGGVLRIMTPRQYQEMKEKEAYPLLQTPEPQDEKKQESNQEKPRSEP